MTVSDKTAARSKRTEADLLLEDHLKELALGKIEREHRFHPVRLWRFDYAVPEKMLAIEIEGGIWINGGHNRGLIYQKNLDKYNSATAIGWKLFRFSPMDVLIGKDLEYLREWLRYREGVR